jgi:hypothetical protein
MPSPLLAGDAVLVAIQTSVGLTTTTVAVVAERFLSYITHSWLTVGSAVAKCLSPERLTLGPLLTLASHFFGRQRCVDPEFEPGIVEVLANG